MPNSYILGSEVQLQDLITDPNNGNAPVTGATDVCTVYLPDGTTSQPAVTEIGGGVYRALYVPTITGWHEAVFEVAPGNSGANANRTRFWVAPVP